jgi:vWA-MoxR associated protein C-terminal domain/vWA-MoxR associated protein middle region 0/Effector-associated domain 2
VIRMDVVVRYLPHLAPLFAGRTAASGHPRPPVRTWSAPERRLSDTELGSLFALFWAVPAMPSRSARDFYLDLLEKRLGGHLTISRQPDDVMDGWAVLFALLDRPGSLRMLGGLLEGMHVGHPAAGRFVEFVELTFPDLMLEQAERTELEGRLMGVGWARIGAAYRYATRRFGVPPTIAPTAVGQVIRDLEARGRTRGGVPSLLVMVDDLAHAIGGDLSLDLHRWSDRTADRLRVPRDERRLLCDDATRRYARPVPAHLVVVLKPDGVDLERFLLSAVVIVAGEPERPVFRDDVARTLAEIEQALDDHVLPLVPEAVGGDADGLVIEFVLPDRLLDTPVERWQFDRRSFPRPVGIRYPVVVRSRERILDRSTHDLWQALTRRMHAEGRQGGPQVVHVVHRDGRAAPAPDEAGTLWAHLVGAEQTVVLAVPFPPDRGGTAAPDVFDAGLKAGLPAIVWARSVVDPAAFEGAVRNELLAEGAEDLPRQVWRYRLRHRGAITPSPDADDSRPPLGLLFDDAARIPSQLRRTYQFRAPGSGQGPGGSRP